MLKKTKTSTLGKRKQAAAMAMTATSPSQEQQQERKQPRREQQQRRSFSGAGGDQDDEEKEQRQPNVSESKFHDSDEDDNGSEDSAGDDYGHHDNSDEEEEFVLDRKDLLIVKDGTIRVAESLDQQQFDANGEAIKASGTWTKAEHDRFLKAMETYPKGPWKAIAAMVGSRTVRQTQTHAQKYREKMARRMRGLRNRNGTLQYPASGSSGGDAMYDFGGGSALGGLGTVSSHDRMTAVYQPASAMASRHHHFPHHLPHHQQQQQYHHQQQQHYQVMSGMPMAPSMHAHGAVAPTSMEFNQLSTSSISSAFIGNTSYPPSWDPRHPPGAAVPLAVPAAARAAASSGSTSSSPETGAAGPSAVPAAARATGKVPDFDESMDFLMNVYSSNPSQLGDTALPEDAFFKRE